MILAPVLNVQGVRVAAGAAAEAFNAVIVSGAGTVEVNGTYDAFVIEAGKQAYKKSANNYLLFWDGSSWALTNSDTSQTWYDSASDTNFPWEAEWTVATGTLPVPTFTPTNV